MSTVVFYRSYRANSVSPFPLPH